MARRTDPSPAVRSVVWERDARLCARCGSGGPQSLHHRRTRGMGGTRRPDANLPANLIVLCGSGTTGCHGWVTEHPREARELGLVVSQHATPEHVAVTTWRGLLLLDNTGGFTITRRDLIST